MSIESLSSIFSTAYIISSSFSVGDRLCGFQVLQYEYTEVIWNSNSESVLSALSKFRQVLSQMTPPPFWSNVFNEVTAIFEKDNDPKLWAIITLLDMHCDLGWKSSLSSVSWVRFPCLLERLFLDFSLVWLSSPIWNNFELSTVLKNEFKKMLKIKSEHPCLFCPFFYALVFNCKLRLNMTDKLFLWNPYD